MSSRERLLGSLAGRLILSLSAGIVIALAIWLFVYHILVRNELYGSFDETLVARMQSLAAYAVQNPGAEGIAEFMPAVPHPAARELLPDLGRGGQRAGPGRVGRAARTCRARRP